MVILYLKINVHVSNFVARKNDKSTSENVTNLRFKKTEMMEC